MTRWPDCYEGLRRAVREQHGPAAARILDDVYGLAAQEHSGEFRKSGEPYITHPVEVARLVCSWGQPFQLICAALLHDIPPSRLRRRGNGDVVDRDVIALVEAVAGLDHTHRRDDERLASAPRDALLLKIADRLHNARTWSFVPRTAARVKAQQTLDIYTAVARDLGLAHVAAELTTLAAATLAGSDISRIAPGAAQALPRARSPQLSGVTGRVLCRAVMLLPPTDRVRYLEEWTAELLAAPSGGARLRTALGLHYAAIRIRVFDRS